MMKQLAKLQNKSLYIPFIEIFAKGISFINLLIFIRILSINDYAIYSYALSIVLWASVVMDGGISNLIYKKSLKKDTDNLNSLFFARLVFSIIVILFLTFFIYQKKTEYVLIVLISSFIVLFSSTSSLLKMFARGNGYTNVDIIIILSEPILRFTFLIFVYFSIDLLSWNLYQILLVYLMAGVLAFIINYKTLDKYYHFRLFNRVTINTFEVLKKLFHESKYYLLYYLMFVGISRVDIIFIEQYSIKKNLALFSSAINLYQVIQLFFFALITSQFLLLLKNKKIFFKYLILSLIVTIIILVFISRFIYLFLFPVNYSQGYIIFNFLILALFPSVLNYFLITRNNYLNKVKINSIILTLFLALKTGLYFFLKSKNINTYFTIFPVVEFGILFAFLIYNKFYESTSNK